MEHAPPTSQPHDRHTTLRHAQLLGVLLFFHLAGPIVQSTSPGFATLALLPMYMLVLGSATYVLTTGRTRVIVGVLALPMIAALVAVTLTRSVDALALPSAALPFVAFTAYVVFRGVLAHGVINEAKLLGSASVFILLAQVWAGVYAGLEWIAPGSFASAVASEAITAGDLAYFSLVTQTTLGFGDITPISRIARAAATLQAITGLFYMGVVVARFAGRLELHRPAE